MRWRVAREDGHGSAVPLRKRRTIRAQHAAPLQKEKGSGVAGPEAADEGAEAVDEGIVGRSGFLCGGLRTGGLRSAGRSGRGGGGGDEFAFDAALEDERGANADPANENDHFGVDIGLDGSFGVVTERRDDDLVDGLGHSRRFGTAGRGEIGARVAKVAVAAEFFRGGDAADFGNGRRGELRELQIAGATAGRGAEEINLAVDELDVAALRDDDVLTGELMFDEYGDASGVNAHETGSVDACGGVLRGIADGDGLGFDLRGVNRERGGVLDVGVDGAGIKRDGEPAAGFEDGKMGGAADGDLTAFNEVDARSAGLDANVGAAAKERFDLAAVALNAHGAGDGDGVAFDGADEIADVGVVGGGAGEDGEE